MLTDKSIDALVQPIINIYNQIEYELIISIAKRFDTYDSVGGSLEWHLKKLDELGALSKDALNIIANLSKKSKTEIVEMLKQSAYANIDFQTLSEAFSAGVISVSPDIIKNGSAFAQLITDTYKSLDKTYRLIQTKALESVKQSYMNVINRTYIEVSTGVYDYNTSIKRGIQQMAQNGITGATYKRGNKIVKYSLEGTVRRDTLSAVHKLANKSTERTLEELGAEYVETSSHLGARVHPTNPIANHAGWQGKIFKVHGSDKYPNLKESTGYPDDIMGLGGVNCRHRMFVFFPGISKPNPIKFNEAENKKAYELSQRQRSLERQMRELKKRQAAAKTIDDKDAVKDLTAKIKAKSDEIDTFCKINGLKRDHSRELVTEQIVKEVLS